VLLLDDKMNKTGVGIDPHVLSLTHGVVELEQLSPEYGTSRRRLRVSKLRGVRYREGYHDYTIVTGGLRVFPRLVAAEHHAQFVREPVSSGVRELDQLLGGGLDRGTTTLLIGSAGSGKSSVAVQYAVRMAERDERSAIFAFDETLGILTARADSLGLPLRHYIESGTIHAQQIDPAEISPGEFAWTVRGHVEAGRKLIVIDSLNGYLNAMPGEKYLNSQLHELSSYLNEQGVVTILIMAQHGMVMALESPVDLSYLCDTVINLRYFEAAGEVKQSVAVIKKRSGNHERTIREFMLDSRAHGIRIGEPLKEFQGILTGVPRFEGKHDKMLGS
jgi:circadian clock protein KaiC